MGGLQDGDDEGDASTAQSDQEGDTRRYVFAAIVVIMFEFLLYKCWLDSLELDIAVRFWIALWYLCYLLNLDCWHASKK